MERPVRGLEDDDDPRAVEEAERAAAEAAGIGGDVGDEDIDPAMRPVYEHGGGEAEGFEQAEELLIDNASHGDPAPSPTDHQIIMNAEAQRSTAAYGDPDEIEASSLSDPEQFEKQDLNERQDPE
jgi:hypothetical protein